MNPFKPSGSPVAAALLRAAACIGAALFALGQSGAAPAAQTDLANTPFFRTGVQPAPNLLFLMDTSVFMAKGWHPSQVGFDNGGYGLCKVYMVTDNDYPGNLYIRHANGSNYNGTGVKFSQTTVCREGDPPFNAPEVNVIFYNPKIRYVPPPKQADGTTFPSQTNPAVVAKDPFLGASKGTIDVTTKSQEVVYCTSPLDNPYGPNCKRNGQTGAVTGYDYPDNAKGPLVPAGTPVYQRGNQPANKCSFTQQSNAGACFYVEPMTGLPITPSTSSHNPIPGTYPYALTREGPPFYYNLIYTEYCDKVGANCVAAGSPLANTGIYTYPAKVRYCRSPNYAYDPGVVTGDQSPGNPKCSFIYEPFTYHEGRLPKFSRVDIVPSMAPTVGGPDRTDCANPNACTYAEEIVNYANFYAYYGTKEKIVKSSVARSFITLDTSLNIGFVTTTPVSSGRWWSPNVANNLYQPILPFDDTQKNAFLTRMFKQEAQISAEFEPAIKEGLTRAGRHFAGKNDQMNDGMNEDPVKYSCQKNFTMLVTDAYQSYYEIQVTTGKDVSGAAIGNLDNVNSGYSTRARGNYDGNLTGASGTLADLALYYYQTDLRGPAFNNQTNRQTGVDVSTNNVPTNVTDNASHQHMNLFVVGMTAGKMLYDPLYQTRNSGDFYDIRNGNSGCRWAPGQTCNWPVPVPNGAYDVAWQAAVAGGGTYYEAVSPKQMMTSLKGALSTISLAAGSSSAAATSNAVLTSSDRDVFSTSYKTLEWTGEIVARKIDLTSGNIDTTAGISWSAQALLDTKVQLGDTRQIYLGSPTGTGVKDFRWTQLDSTEQGYFANKCAMLTQCGALSPSEQVSANDGAKLVNFLRGRHDDEGALFRTRTHVLGDMVNAQPLFVGAPRFTFSDASPSYADFKSGPAATRLKTLYAGANDGMLHAFDVATGQERWAYIPRMLLPTLPKLADNNFSTSHLYYVDGSPETMDVVIGGVWKTVLVGGLNAGGRGYYALDITDPAAPTGLWEICPTALCSVVDKDLGYSFGRPIIAKRRVGTGTPQWVVLVTSGYNNDAAGCTACGQGILYVLDIATGAVLEKISTGVGSAAQPAGLAQISGYADDFSTNNTVKYVYGGDLLGNVWRFDLTQSPALKTKLAMLQVGGKGQPVTTRPELGDVQGVPLVIVGTGKLLGTSDYTDQSALGIAYEQSLYAIKDTTADASTAFRSLTNVVQQQITASGSDRTVTSNAVDWSTKAGWFIDFNAGGAASGERVALVPPILEDGTLVVITSVPNPTACTIGGESWRYLLDFATGGRVQSTSSTVLPPGQKSNSLIVGLAVFTLPGGAKKDLETDMTGGTTANPIPPNSVMSSRKTSWRDLPQ